MLGRASWVAGAGTKLTGGLLAKPTTSQMGPHQEAELAVGLRPRVCSVLPQPRFSICEMGWLRGVSGVEATPSRPEREGVSMRPVVLLNL